jgi:hypothetical protein
MSRRLKVSHGETRLSRKAFGKNPPQQRMVIDRGVDADHAPEASRRTSHTPVCT